MRITILTSLFILLTSCGTTNYYDQTTRHFRGQSGHDLIAKLGQPNQIIQYTDGSQTFIYITQQPLYSGNVDYQTQVFVAGNKTFGVQVPRNQPKTMMTGCTAEFVLNKQGKIISEQFQGGGCSSSRLGYQPN